MIPLLTGSLPKRERIRKYIHAGLTPEDSCGKLPALFSWIVELNTLRAFNCLGGVIQLPFSVATLAIGPVPSLSLCGHFCEFPFHNRCALANQKYFDKEKL